MIVDERTGILKLADFGNAKLLRSFEENTPYQVTRYYRAPELIFGSVHYTTAIGSSFTVWSYKFHGFCSSNLEIRSTEELHF
uniref:Protein kinase domain-containing protein n=1 Tax=Parascaris equorum TaxID=6256 RepID=A0A914R423_PAREQ